MSHGFTLVEILVGILVLSVLIAGIYGVLNVGDMAYNYDAGLIDLQQQARQAMDGMIREIRQNRIADITITDGQGTVVNPGSVINFKIPDSNYCFRYLLVNSQVIREIRDCLTLNKLNERIVANNIASLGFSSNSNTVAIELKAYKKARNKELWFPKADLSLIGQAVLRNPGS